MHALIDLPRRAEWFVLVPVDAPVVFLFDMPAPHYLKAPPGRIVAFQKDDGASRLAAFGARFAAAHGREYEAHSSLTRRAVVQPVVLPIWTDPQAAARFAQQDLTAYLAENPLAVPPRLGVVRAWHDQLQTLCREAPAMFQPVVGVLVDHDGERVDFWGLADFDFTSV